MTPAARPLALFALASMLLLAGCTMPQETTPTPNVNDSTNQTGSQQLDGTLVVVNATNNTPTGHVNDTSMLP